MILMYTLKFTTFVQLVEIDYALLGEMVLVLVIFLMEGRNYFNNYVRTIVDYIRTFHCFRLFSLHKNCNYIAPIFRNQRLWCFDMFTNIEQGGGC